MLNMEEFNQLFVGLQHGAWRLLTLDNYNVTDTERARVAEWRRTGQVPDRTGDQWLRMVEDYAQRGVPFARTHVFPGSGSLTEYCEYILRSYRFNDEAGERVSIADRGAHPELVALDHDFWVLDDRVVVLQYAADRSYAGAYIATGEEAQLRLDHQKIAMRWAMPLARYEAGRKGRLTA